ncbi:hypothetical protein [Cupriavidus consociatus]|uniref:bestrophin-like domain n=1 Tax=Cupriavidus consociatus TaxID=2821357 RepID=UPI001AE7F2CF|nr:MULTISPECIES: hypothetical protein [unclassified Cupriavidus]MBP0620847.1 hypothetical protein [Cupriavidus sp. LEh25]MDK2657509.1 hypothetical protein [Cupriavidus sp. LEh21]
MSQLVIALIAFLCIFCAAMLGLYLRDVLPEHHLSEESSSAIKLATGLIATIAALVLGLLISSAKSTFDTVKGDLVHNAASIVHLDRLLFHYGPPAQELRATLRRDYAMWVELLASRDAAHTARLSNPEISVRVEAFQRKVAELSPTTPSQREIQARALQISDEVFASRSLALLQREGSVALPLLVVLVSWLAIIFGAFGLLAPRNGTIVVALLLCALSASGAILLILEMDTPLDGVIKVSLTPMREALARLGN